MILFNLIFIITEMILYSGLVIQLDFRTALLTGILSMIGFVSINGLFLAYHERIQRPENLKTFRDCRNALRYRMKQSGLFRDELKTAFFQLETFAQKESLLKHLVQKDSPFLEISHDAELCLCANMKKLLGRTLIIARKAEIYQILNQNQELLSQYDAFLSEISRLGETSNTPDLELIINALQELREEES